MPPPPARRALSVLARPLRVPRRLRDQRRHREALATVLGDPELCRAFAGTGALPPGHGLSLSERLVELPWLVGSDPRGSVLDAGSTLSHAVVLDVLLPRVDRLDVVTLAPERRSFPERGVSYLWADLRDLPLRDASYDTVVSLSTLEHVGLDTSQYGAAAATGMAPDEETARAVTELRRVLRPGGRLLASVPYGVRENLGWMRQLDADGVRKLVAAFGPAAATTVQVFAYGLAGWRRSTLEDAAGARYRSRQRELFPADGARAARAVACMSLTKPL